MSNSTANATRAWANKNFSNYYNSETKTYKLIPGMETKEATNAAANLAKNEAEARNAAFKEIQNYNYTEFLSGRKVAIVSDIEGLCPTEYYNKVRELCYNTDKNIGMIFLGDALDYTIAPIVPPEHYDALLPNGCSLKLLKCLVDGMKEGNVKCLIGNRELNKIKMLALNQTHEEQYAKWWTNGADLETIVANFINSYYAVKKYDNTNFFKVSNLLPFSPYWGLKNLLPDLWYNDNIKNPASATLYDRFCTIFGVDTKVGTISAQNNVDFMPFELYENNSKLEEIITNIRNKLNLENGTVFAMGVKASSVLTKEIMTFKDYIEANRAAMEELNIVIKDMEQDIKIRTNRTNQANNGTALQLIKDDLKTKMKTVLPYNYTKDTLLPTLIDRNELVKKNSIENEIKSAIVFTVYARLLDSNKINKISYGNLDNMDGYLHDYLRLAQTAAYGNINNDLYLFSHGSIYQNFIDANETALNKLNKLSNNAFYNIGTKGKIVKQSGGSTEIQNVYDHINAFNTGCSELIIKLFKNEDNENILNTKHELPSPGKILSTLLAICAPPIADTYGAGALSPIIAYSPMGVPVLNINTNGKVFNIHGHIPAGASYRISVNDNNKNLFTINTDISNGLMKDTLLLGLPGGSEDTYNENYLIMYLDNLSNTSPVQLAFDGALQFKNNFLEKNQQLTSPLECVKKNGSIGLYVDADYIKQGSTQDSTAITFNNSIDINKLADIINNANCAGVAFHGIINNNNDDQFYLISKTNAGPAYPTFPKAIGIYNVNQAQAIQAPAPAPAPAAPALAPAPALAAPLAPLAPAPAQLQLKPAVPAKSDQVLAAKQKQKEAQAAAKQKQKEAEAAAKANANKYSVQGIVRKFEEGTSPDATAGGSRTKYSKKFNKSRKYNKMRNSSRKTNRKVRKSKMH